MRGKRIDPYGVTLYVGFTGFERDELCEKFDLKFEDDCAGAVYISTHVRTGKTCVTVLIDGQYARSRGTAFLVDTIAHESTHAAGTILKHVGQKHDGRTEAFAYLVGFIAGHIYKEWEKRA